MARGKALSAHPEALQEAALKDNELALLMWWHLLRVLLVTKNVNTTVTHTGDFFEILPQEAFVYREHIAAVGLTTSIRLLCISTCNVNLFKIVKSWPRIITRKVILGKI